MEEPEGYDRNLYRSCCDNPLAENLGGVNPLGQQLWSPEMMLSYGRLPDGYMMLNWPVGGNDIYLEYLDMPREEVYRLAKNRTLGYIYFLQKELGYKNLDIADDVFPSADGLPFYPYYRESRRFAGRDTMTVDAAKRPYDFDLYTRAVAVAESNSTQFAARLRKNAASSFLPRRSAICAAHQSSYAHSSVRDTLSPLISSNG